MKQHKYQILAAAVAVFLLLLGMLLYSRLADPAKFWRCNPAKPRGNDLETWQKTITPAQPIEEIDEDFLDNFTVSSDSDYFTIEYPLEYPPGNPFSFELNELAAGETLEIGGGTMAFSCIGIAYHDANQTISEDAIYRFYDHQLKPMANTDVSRFHNPDVSKFGMYALTVSGSDFRNEPWPAVQLFFEHRQIEHLMIHNIKIFDSRTRKSLITGYSSGGNDGFHCFKTHIPLWHRTPIDLVVDVSYGPIKTFEFAPREGEGFNVNNFKCRLISVFEGDDDRTISSSSRNNVMISKFRKTPDKTGLYFFFACLPAAHNMPVTFELLDKDGNKLPTRGSSNSGYTNRIRMEQPLETIALIRAHYRSRRQRIVFHMPYLPGLPEENDTINNLFDIHIPYVRFIEPGYVDRLLQRTLQLSRSGTTGPVPGTRINSLPFPLDFNDVTIRDIARSYAQGGSLHVDIEN
ncbi:MAG: hypothetical protein ACYSUX_12620, partial [Planctomycetota bacterium]